VSAARSTRSLQGEETRERLLDAAVALISERGYAATGVGLVCQRAGVAKTALYWHFGSKEGLLAAVVERVGTAWIEEIQKRAYLEGDPLQRIHRLTLEWRRILLEQPHLIRLPMVAQLEQGEASESTRAALATVWKRAEQALVQGIEDSLGTPLPDLDLVAHTTMALLQGAVLRQIVEPDEAELDRILAELRRTLVLLVWHRLPGEWKEKLPPPALS
jgi:AcrR family transcriptional regulator